MHSVKCAKNTLCYPLFHPKSNMCPSVRQHRGYYFLKVISGELMMSLARIQYLSNIQAAGDVCFLRLSAQTVRSHCETDLQLPGLLGTRPLCPHTLHNSPALSNHCVEPATHNIIASTSKNTADLLIYCSDWECKGSLRQHC